MQFVSRERSLACFEGSVIRSPSICSFSGRAALHSRGGPAMQSRWRWRRMGRCTCQTASVASCTPPSQVCFSRWGGGGAAAVVVVLHGEVFCSVKRRGVLLCKAPTAYRGIECRRGRPACSLAYARHQRTCPCCTPVRDVLHSPAVRGSQRRRQSAAAAAAEAAAAVAAQGRAWFRSCTACR